MKFNVLAIAAAAASLSLAACNKAPQQPLSSVKVPAGFTFATSHGVTIDLKAAASALPASGRGELDIARADGKTIFRGQMNAAAPLHIKLSVPLKDAELIATLEGPNGKASVKVPIANEAAAWSFQ